MTSNETHRSLSAEAFHAARRYVQLSCGRVAYVEQGEGPVLLLLHGVPLNGFHWRHVMAGMADARRCIAPDLLGLGYSEVGDDTDLSVVAQAAMVGEFLDALDLHEVDLAGNDNGGAVAQIFAARHPGQVRTLTLTNCDVHDGWPPRPTLPLVALAVEGALADRYAGLARDPARARQALQRAYADTDFLTPEVLSLYFDPIVATPLRKRAFHRYWTSFDAAQTVAVEPLLKQLRVPTLIVWGIDDEFFDVRWAHWLRDTIPGARPVVTVPGARLFFPEDRPQALLAPLRDHLSHPTPETPR